MRIDSENPGAPPGLERLRFVRFFLLLLLGAAGALAAVAGWLSWRLGMELSVAGQGFVEPEGRRLVKSALGGILHQVAVRQGQRVEAGALLAALDDREWRAELLKVEKDLEIVRSRRRELEERQLQERRAGLAEVARAGLELERAALHLEQARTEQQLYTEIALVPRRGLEQLWPVRHARTSLAQRQVELELARQRLAGVEAYRRELKTLEKTGEKLLQDRSLLIARLEQALIRAPVAGAVLTADLERRVGDYLHSGEPLLELAQAGRWQARVLVDELDLPRVRAGQPARLYLRAFPHLEHQVFAGQVRSVAPAPSVQGEGYEVKVALTDPQAEEYPLACGMRAEVRILVERGRIAALARRWLARQFGQRGQQHFYLLPAGE